MWPFGKPTTSSEESEGQPSRPTRSNLDLQETPLQSLLELPQGIRRRHARTPSPTNIADGNFNYPDHDRQLTMPNSDDLRSASANIITLDTGETIDIDLLRQQAAAAAQQAAQASAALEAATSALRISHKKKPDIPDFDHKNIEIWIKRVEAAYLRANVTTAADKFAYLESKIAVNFNPAIDEYLYGAATDDKWEEFIEYLKDEYGLSKQQKAATFLDGIKRDGRRPSQHLARINQISKNITLDDLRKEMVLKSLPAEVLRIVAPRTRELSAVEAAKMADDFFDKEGKCLHSATPPINQVTEPPQQQQNLPANDTDDDQINAVGGHLRFTPAFSNVPHRSRTPGRNYNNFRSKSRGGNRNGNASGPHQNSNASNFNSNSNTPGMCFYHSTFGAKAKKCESPCSWKPQPFSQGNGNAGRRM